MVKYLWSQSKIFTVEVWINSLGSFVTHYSVKRLMVISAILYHERSTFSMKMYLVCPSSDVTVVPVERVENPISDLTRVAVEA